MPTRPTGATRIRRLVLLALVLFLLATAAPGSAGRSKTRRDDGALPDSGTAPYTATSVDGQGQKFRGPAPR